MIGGRDYHARAHQQALPDGSLLHLGLLPVAQPDLRPLEGVLNTQRTGSANPKGHKPVVARYFHAYDRIIGSSDVSGMSCKVLCGNVTPLLDFGSAGAYMLVGLGAQVSAPPAQTTHASWTWQTPLLCCDMNQRTCGCSM